MVIIADKNVLGYLLIEIEKMNYALVTGASSGMGLQFSIQLASMGYGIIIVSNRHDENVAAQEMIRLKSSVDTRVIDVDLTEHDSAQRIYNQVHEWGIQVDVLVSNAGILLFSTLDRTAPGAVDKIISLHCTTPVKLIRLFGHDMMERRTGYILITSSSTAWMQYPTISVYGATKAFLKNFSRSVWYEYRRYGVSVTTFFPGAVDTPLYKLDDRMRHILRRMGVMMSAERAVNIALRSMFARHYRCIPGVFTKIIVCLCSIVPAWLFRLFLRIPAIQRLLDRV